GRLGGGERAAWRARAAHRRLDGLAAEGAEAIEAEGERQRQRSARRDVEVAAAVDGAVAGARVQLLHVEHGAVGRDAGAQLLVRQAGVDELERPALQREPADGTWPRTA